MVRYQHEWALVMLTRLYMLGRLGGYKIEQKMYGRRINNFGSGIPKLLLNFTWWVNRKDKEGKIFSGRLSGLRYMVFSTVVLPTNWWRYPTGRC